MSHSPSTANSETLRVVVPSGGIDIKSIVRQGFIQDDNGEKVLVGRAKWKDSLILMANVIYHEEVTFGLKPEDLELKKSWRVKPIPATDFRCRYCDKGFASRRSSIVHEKRCKVPGGPGHLCGEWCTPICKGTGVWTRPRDARHNNPGRPRA